MGRHHQRAGRPVNVGYFGKLGHILLKVVYVLFVVRRREGGNRMNETEKRRKELLAQARSMYRDDKGIPAVHPRYRASYQQIYGKDEEEERESSSFGIRAFLCILLFAVFVAADYKDTNIGGVERAAIVNQIQKGVSTVNIFRGKLP